MKKMKTMKEIASWQEVCLDPILKTPSAILKSS